MAPDLNSLPSSRPPSASSPLAQRPRRISVNDADVSYPSPPSPRSPSLSSLQAAATINAGLQRPSGTASPGRNHPSLERRRSSLLNSFSINDPTVPAPGEMQLSNGSHSASPGPRRRSFALTAAAAHHHRQPSLGELHQELENEQEAQVNRLLQMIRLQQDQLANIQRQQQQQQQPPDPASTNTEQIPTSGPSSALAAVNTTPHEHISSPHMAALPSPNHYFNRPASLSRRSSNRLSHAGSNSRGNSPALRPHSGSFGPSTEELMLGGSRDECAFYQAETQMLTRENQMLKLRIRELERQIADMSGASNTSHHAAVPTHSSSPLANQPATFARESVPALSAEADSYAKVD